MNDSQGKGRHTRNLERARVVQMGMLPQIPRVEGIELAPSYRPCEHLGGDFYDFIEIDARHVGIVMADVSGHGTAAALLMASTKKVLQLIGKGQLSPKQVLLEVNDSIRTDLPGNMFITIFYGVLDVPTRRLLWVSAGHNPPLLMRGGNVTANWKQPNAPVIGLLPSEQLGKQMAENRLQLEKDDVLLIYTDGLTEALDVKDEQYGEERLMQDLQAASKTSAAAMIEFLCSQADAFRKGAERSDDETLIALKVTAPPQPVSAPSLPAIAKESWLPKYSGELLGRNDDLSALRGLLEKHTGVITLTGPAGVGKTRLAIAGVDESRSQFPGGTYYVELQPAKDVGDVCRRVANALGLGAEQTALGNRIALALANAPGPSVLVLDNVEGCAEHVKRCVKEWRTGSPRTSFVITSRAPLDLPGEAHLAVKPLTSMRRTRRVRVTYEMAQQDPAIQLFVQVARREDPSFDLTRDNAELLNEIVARLDGLPHAIELAAARVGLLSPRQILDRLDERFELLRGEGKDQRSTLHGTLAWSWELLDDAQRQAVMRLCPFPDGFAPELAAQVLKLKNAGDIDGVLKTLIRLGLMYADRLPELDGETRYYLFESLRMFAFEKLKETGDADAGVTRFEKSLVSYALKWWKQAMKDGSSEASRRLGVEVEGLEDIAEHGEHHETRAWAVVMVAPFLQDRGETARALELIEDAIPGLLPGDDDWIWLHIVKATLRAQTDSEEVVTELEKLKPEGIGRYHALVAQGRALQQLGHMSDAARCWKQAAAVPGIGKINLGNLKIHLARLYQQLGKHEEAETLLENALQVAHEEKDSHLEGTVLYHFGLLNRRRGNTAEAIKYLREGMRIAQLLGRRRLEGNCLSTLAVCMNLQGEKRTAEAAILRSIRIAREGGLLSSLGAALNTAGSIYFEQGRVEEALKACSESRDVSEQAGERKTQAIAESNIAALRAELGQEQGALESLKKAHAILVELKDLRSTLSVLGNIGELHAMRWKSDRDKKDLKLAMDALQRATSERRRLGFDPLIGAEITMADLLAESGKYGEAEEVLDTLQATAEQRSDQYSLDILQRAENLRARMEQSKPQLPRKRARAKTSGKSLKQKPVEKPVKKPGNKRPRGVPPRRRRKL